ncbi:MAG: HigA family addiction module antitoxin [Acidobacteriaceae bacterium]
MPTKSKSSTTTKAKRRPPLHPGEMLREEFMVPLGMSANAVAMAIRVPATRIAEIVNERRGITADTALRLGRLFRMSPQYWMGLQADYDLETAMDQIEEALDQDIRPLPVDRETGGLRVA